MKAQINKINQQDGTILIMIEVDDELLASSRQCDDCTTLTESFCKEWLNQEEPPEEIELIPYMGSYFWNVNEQMVEVVQSNESSLQPEDEGEETFEEFLNNENISSITTPKEDLEELENLWSSTNNLYEIVCEDSDSEEDECNSPYYEKWQKAENELYAKVWSIKNQLPSPPEEFKTFTDMYGNVYDTLQQCEEGERQINFQITQDTLEKMEHEARQNLRKPKLVKKADLPKKVDFELLINSPFSIWNGGYEKAETQSITETVQQGELAAQNLELFLSLMKNPKFATRASFEIEKLLKKSKNVLQISN